MSSGFSVRFDVSPGSALVYITSFWMSGSAPRQEGTSTPVLSTMCTGSEPGV